MAKARIAIPLMDWRPETAQERALRLEARLKKINETPPITFHKYIHDRKRVLEKTKKSVA